ncbi:MAG: alpha/beta fold hydrolase [Dehalococcoidia bacterium]
MKFRWEGGEVTGAWDRPAGRAKAAVVLAHGAGYNLNTKLLVDVGKALAERGVAVLRFNFPYTEAGRRGPDPQKRLEACYRAVAEAVAEEMPRPFLGGKSMGGRIASHVAADGFDSGGLVFLGYPLHPPGKPERIRDAHLRGIAAPMLFLQGARDPFATPDLLHATLKSLKTATLVGIEGGDHSFKVKGRSTEEVTAELVEQVAAFIEEHAG